MPPTKPMNDVRTSYDRSGSEQGYDPVCPATATGKHDFHATHCAQCGCPRKVTSVAAYKAATTLPDDYAAQAELPRRGVTYNDALHDTSDDGVMGLAMTALVALGVAFGMGVATGVAGVWLWEHVL